MLSEKIIIFTRYPEPGKTKTRLIPVLGAEGAANLHKEMTEDTINRVIDLVLLRPNLSVEVRFTGGNLILMENWLGTNRNLIYQSQGEGDLGERMYQAFFDAFASGIDKVVIIGTDCPDLDVTILNQAFVSLDNSATNLVLGEALDGGYYLIGLRQLIPQLFQDINWGTSAVWPQTIAIAQKYHFQIISLTPLADIDRPEDLAIWQKFKQK